MDIAPSAFCAKSPDTYSMPLKFTFPPRTEWKTTGLVYALALGLLSMMLMISWVGGYSLKSQLRHPASAAQISPLLGGIFYLGVLTWAAGAAICAFCYLILRQQHSSEAKFFLYSTLVTSMLVFDKLFELNDYVFPRYLGIGEGSAYLLYGAILVYYLFTFRNTLWRTNFIPLAVAFVFWAVATFLDLSYLILPFYYPRWVYLAKDILKLLGIVGWTAYFVMAGLDAIRTTAFQIGRKTNHA